MKKLLILLLFVASIFTLNAQTPAIVRGYIGGNYLTTNKLVGVNINDSLNNVGLTLFDKNDSKTINFNIIKEKITLLEDSIVRTEYMLANNNLLVVEPYYENSVYVSDYCKLIVKNVDVFDKLVILFFK